MSSRTTQGVDLFSFFQMRMHNAMHVPRQQQQQQQHNPNLMIPLHLTCNQEYNMTIAILRQLFCSVNRNIITKRARCVHLLTPDVYVRTYF